MQNNLFPIRPALPALTVVGSVEPWPDAFVAVDNPASVIHWTRHFGISAEALREAAADAGPTAYAIAGYLRAKGSSGLLKPKFRVVSF